ncbi:MAG: Ig-like domain-containing protein [Bacteroidales bacterium]|nr:Ig-like domain-containing protein [Bacteroidales bacterium]MCL2738927.1 Ig-like domain-containing protein [Bacteroidales bacterium]
MYRNVKNLRPFVFAFLLSSLYLTGCEDVDCCMPGVISASPSTVTLVGVNNVATTIINCNMPWNMTTDLPPWLEMEIAAGSVAFKAISIPGQPSCTLTFMASNGDKTTVTVRYEPALVANIDIDPDVIVLSIDDLPSPPTLTLTADIEPTNADNQNLTWSSNNTAIATVDAATGVVTITGTVGGIAIITAAATDGSGVSGACTITITDGTQDFPFQIKDAFDLEKLRDEVNGGEDKAGQYFIMTQDIPLTSSNWIPIGKDLSHPFSGNFDGDGKEVSGLEIHRVGSIGYAGLFGVVEDGAIENLGVKIIEINNGIGSYVGGVAGNLNGGTVSHCYVIGSSSSSEIFGGNSIGGVVGLVNHGGKVEYCSASIDVHGAQAIGGVVGRTDDVSSVANCYATGNISASNQGAGGVVGRVNGGSVTNCYATGAISGTPNGLSPMYLGGIAGRIFAGGSVTHCVALNPSVSTEHTTGAHIGRIVGDNAGFPLNNNHAFSGMNLLEDSLPKTPVSNPADLDGEDCVAIPAASWWTTNMTTWSTSVWNFTDGALPTLK